MVRRDGAKTTGYFGMAPPLALARSGETRGAMRCLRKESRHFARACVTPAPGCLPARAVDDWR
ncbi:hypothetical protein BLA18109_05447 [Burkholderia lata]|uniref:Uncharacterized protein n=1 Tax=Burkholderia lata (strain ATCC 17760 / DSM 23089 / LMG 22485 / NCIMB 9086 / R18194 / 383) TaxID=482957 RepID=A0A6P2XXM3_BURL3|nr:hypothetical protein BLA18109_05447 [Burkholderia lata]